MRLIKKELLPFGDSCVYEVDESELVKRPCYAYADREKFDMRDAVLIGSYANGQPKYEFIYRENGKAFVNAYHSIGD